jgi:hypothetical protein
MKNMPTPAFESRPNADSLEQKRDEYITNAIEVLSMKNDESKEIIKDLKKYENPYEFVAAAALKLKALVIKQIEKEHGVSTEQGTFDLSREYPSDSVLRVTEEYLKKELYDSGYFEKAA